MTTQKQPGPQPDGGNMGGHQVPDRDLRETGKESTSSGVNERTGHTRKDNAEQSDLEQAANRQRESAPDLTTPSSPGDAKLVSDEDTDS